jgi:hypothetical protein
VDGVVLVFLPGHTHLDPAKASVEQMKRAGANVIGAIFNHMPRNHSDYYGGSYYNPWRGHPRRLDGSWWLSLKKDFGESYRKRPTWRGMPVSIWREDEKSIQELEEHPG